MRILLKLHILALAFLAGAAIYAQETPAPAAAASEVVQQQPVWHAEKAQYRLKVHVKTPKKYYFVDDRMLCLPGSTANGMMAYDADGKQINVYQFPDGGFQLAQVSKETDLYLYYDFPEKIESKDDDRKIRNDYLCFRDSGWDYWNHPNDRRARLISDYQKDIENTEVTDETRVQRQEQIVKVQGWDDATMELYYAKEMTNNSPRQTNVCMTRTYLDHRVNEGAYNRLFTFSGNLKVDKTGDYSFRLFSNANHVLKIDDKILIKHFGARPDVMKDECALFLEEGIHSFTASYHEGNGDIRFAVEWRKPDETEFRELYDSDFAPALIPDFIELTGKDGSKYPVCMQIPSFPVFTAKSETATLRQLIPANDAARGSYLTCDGYEYRNEPDGRYFITRDPNPPQLILNPPEASGFRPVPFHVTANPKRKFPIPADVSLKLWTPYFLYDDEKIELTREICSRFLLPLQVFLTVDTAALPQTDSAEMPERRIEPEFEFDIANKITQRKPLSENDTSAIRHEEHEIHLPRLVSTGLDHFMQDIIVKMPQEINGKEIAAAPCEIEYAIEIPGFTFDRKKIAFVPVDRLREFTVNSDGAICYPGSTCRIIPLLQRLTLTELRTWQLPKAGTAKVMPTERVLVIGEDSGSFRDNLRTKLAEHGVELDFIPWVNSVTGRDTLETLPEIFRTLTRTEPDMLLVIPPNRMRRLTISARDEARVMAFIIETAIRRSTVSSIAISAPIPPNPSVTAADDDDEYCEELRRLKRAYGVDFLELASEFEDIFLTPGSYRMPAQAGSDASESDFPVGASTKLAELFVDAMSRKGNFLSLPFSNPSPSDPD